MKSLALFVVLALASCSKPNETAALYDDAVVLAKYYEPRLAAFERRLDSIATRYEKVPRGQPGIGEIDKKRSEALDMLTDAKKLAARAPNGKTPLENQAAQLANDGKTEELRRLVDETEIRLDESLVEINDRLLAVELWLARAEADMASAQAKASHPAPADTIGLEQNPTGTPAP